MQGLRRLTTLQAAKQRAFRFRTGCRTHGAAHDICAQKPKGYGRNARIEGAMSEGQRVLLVEDLTTDGGSKLSFVDAIRETGASCAHTAVIFITTSSPRRSKPYQIMVLACIIYAHGGMFWPKPRRKMPMIRHLGRGEKFLNNPREWQEKRMGNKG